jgi:hypothetical protein
LQRNNYTGNPSRKWRDISEIERELLEKWTRSRSAPRALASRSEIVLRLADGFSARSVSKQLGVNRRTVMLWKGRFEEGGCAALTKEKPGRGRKRTQRDDT